MTTATKTKVATITISRVEGPTVLCGRTQHTKWRDAEVRITNIRSSVKHDGYDKCDFTLVFDDGTEYKGRYDATSLKRASEGGLSQHVRQHLEFLSGEGRPYHLSPERYQFMVEEINRRSPGTSEGAKAFLNTYSLED
jgi:hypothetical protein